MKSSLNLSIPTPCHEKWDNFTPVSNGRFCDSCSKVVIDFTKMSDQEILAFMQSKPAHACGRFRPNQLKIYSQTPIVKINPGLTLLKASLLSILMMMISKPASAQTANAKPQTEMVQDVFSMGKMLVADEEGRTIRGVVKDDFGDSPLPGVNIILKGTQVGTSTDAYGQFEFPQKLKAGDVLVFTFIGFISKEYEIPKEGKIEVVMLMMELDITGGISIEEVYSEKTGISGWWSRFKARF